MPPINLYELGFDKVYIKIINSSNYISIRLVFCLGLHHFTNENTICLCRKGIYSFYDGVMLQV